MSLTSDLLQQLAQSQAIERHPLIVSPNTLVTEAMTRMSQRRTSCALVVEQQRLVGIFTERDIVNMTAAGRTLEDVVLQEVMTEDPITLSISQEQGVFSVLYLLRKHQIRHLPVVDELGQVFGVITPSKIREILKPADLLKFKQVANVMTTQVIQNSSTASLMQITQQMATHRKSCVVITETHNEVDVFPVGIITERDIVQFQTLQLDFSSVQARQVMSAPLLPIQAGDSLLLANELMKRHHIRRLVVVDESGRLVGIITQSTILEALDPIEMYATLEMLRQEVEERTTQLSQFNEQLQQELQARALLEKQLLEQNIQLQQARKAAESAHIAKNTFLANMSHELRTPLHIILGFTQLLKHSSSISQNEEGYLDHITSAGEHLLKLVNKILELSRQEADGVTNTEINADWFCLPANEPDPTLTEALALTPEDLAALPANWLASLHYATIEGDFEQMLALIDQIRGHEPLVNALTTLVKNLKYEQLLVLTQPRST